MRALVDTSVWIEHLRRGDDELIGLLRNGQVLIHSAVIGELACGFLPNRDRFLSDLSLLTPAREAGTGDVLTLIESRHLHGKGLGWIDAQLLASALLSEARLVTRDKRLAAAYEKMLRR